jgi:hypothetical protein
MGARAHLFHGRLVEVLRDNAKELSMLKKKPNQRTVAAVFVAMLLFWPSVGAKFEGHQPENNGWKMTEENVDAAAYIAHVRVVYGYRTQPIGPSSYRLYVCELVDELKGNFVSTDWVQDHSNGGAIIQNKKFISVIDNSNRHNLGMSFEGGEYILYLNTNLFNEPLYPTATPVNFLSPVAFYSEELRQIILDLMK